MMGGRRFLYFLDSTCRPAMVRAQALQAGACREVSNICKPGPFFEKDEPSQVLCSAQLQVCQF